MKEIYTCLDNLIRGFIRNKYSFNWSQAVLDVPKDKRFGDLSSPVAFRLASLSKRNPEIIAKEIVSFLKDNVGDDIDRIEIISKGFINIFISRKSLIDNFNRLLTEKENFFRQKRNNKVLLEFVSANPTGPLSIAHGRQAVVGDVIGRILSFMGDEVVREYYVNDEGKQIDLFVESVKERIKELKGEHFSIPEGGYHGDYVKKIAREVISDSPHNLRDYIISKMLEVIRKDLLNLDVNFNNWFSQKKLIEEGKVNAVIDKLKDKGFIYEKDGALWFCSSKFGDDKDRVLRKQDGELTYFASDITYHYDKIKRGFSRLINLWGPDHHGYINRVKASIKALGFDNTILDIIIVQLVNIKSKERMSRRKGTALLLSDLFEDVGKDATRFYYLLRRTSSHLEFDIDLAKKASFDNLLYYIQYAHARICSVFRKAGVNEFILEANNYIDGDELSLLRQIFKFGFSLENIYYTLEPLHLIDYLKELATEFHKFYERHRILCDDKNMMRLRINLLEGIRIVLSCGLKLLGVSIPAKM